MKILVIEDELATVRGSFELANLYAFDGNLQITFVVKSQDVNFQHMNEYAVVLQILVQLTILKWMVLAL